jgi:hypothetical protein
VRAQRRTFTRSESTWVAMETIFAEDGLKNQAASTAENNAACALNELI